MLCQVFDDKGALRNNQRLSLSMLYRDYWCLSKWVNLLQLWQSKLVRSSLNGLNIAIELQLLQKPQDALRARFIKPLELYVMSDDAFARWTS